MSKTFLITSTLLLAALTLRCPVATAQALTDQQIVDSFFPQALIDADQGTTSERLSCFAIYDPKTIVAGYSNGFFGDVLVLKLVGNQFQVGYDAASLKIVGLDCSIKLIDLNGDGTNEIVASFSSLRGNSMDWIFTWDGTKLASIGPKRVSPRGTSVSAAMNTRFIDLHAGTIDIVSGGQYPPPADGGPSRPSYVYRLSGGTFQPLAEPVPFSWTFKQGSSGEQKKSFGFPLPAVAGPYSLTLANGNAAGKNQFASGSVSLNGAPVATLSELGASGTLTIPVDLQAQNTIAVDLFGPVGSVLAVVVQGQPSGDVNGDGVVNCADLAVVKASFATTAGQAGYNPAADVNVDGVVNIKDLAVVSKQIPAGTTCQ